MARLMTRGWLHRMAKAGSYPTCTLRETVSAMGKVGERFEDTILCAGTICLVVKWKELYCMGSVDHSHYLTEVLCQVLHMVDGSEVPADLGTAGVWLYLSNLEVS